MEMEFFRQIAKVWSAVRHYAVQGRLVPRHGSGDGRLQAEAQGYQDRYQHDINRMYASWKSAY